MIKKQCANIREKFSDYIDEFLPETEMADLEMHIKNCPSCRKELESFNKTVQALRALPRYTAHPNIIVKINDRIEKEKRWWQRLNNKGFKGVLGAVTAVILCVFGLQIYNNNTNKMNINVVTVGEAAKSPFSVVQKERESGKSVKGNSQSKVLSKVSGEIAAGKADKQIADKKTKSIDREERAKPSDSLDTATPVSFAKAEQQQEKLLAAYAPGEPSAGMKEQDAAAASAPAKLLDEKKSFQKAAAEQSNVLEPRRRKEQSGQTSFEQKGLYCNSTPAVSSGTSIEMITCTVIKDKNTFKEFWKKHFAELSEPSLNFKKDMLLAIFLGEQGSEPKDIVLKDIITEKNRLKVVYTTVSILNTDTSGKKLSPYCLRTVKKTDVPVELVKE